MRWRHRKRRPRWTHGRWGVLGLLAVGLAAALIYFLPAHLLKLDLSEGELRLVGERFFQNECGSDPEKLTHWNRGEAFISLGILHMLWYPAGIAETYRQTFPDFVGFCLDSGHKVPAWILDALPTGCPWSDRQTFYADFQGSLARSLREFLRETTALQAAFAHQRLIKAMRPLLNEVGIQERFPLAIKLFWLGRSATGVFALVDYVNFKGEGLDPKERYQGEGWGLLQVLQGMGLPASADTALAHFVTSAKKVLTRRVANAPNPTKERRWLPGWHKRLETYHASME